MFLRQPVRATSCSHDVTTDLSETQGADVEESLPSLEPEDAEPEPFYEEAIQAIRNPHDNGAISSPYEASQANANTPRHLTKTLRHPPRIHRLQNQAPMDFTSFSEDDGPKPQGLALNHKSDHPPPPLKCSDNRSTSIGAVPTVQALQKDPMTRPQQQHKVDDQDDCPEAEVTCLFCGIEGKLEVINKHYCQKHLDRIIVGLFLQAQRTSTAAQEATEEMAIQPVTSRLNAGSQSLIETDFTFARGMNYQQATGDLALAVQALQKKGAMTKKSLEELKDEIEKQRNQLAGIRENTETICERVSCQNVTMEEIKLRQDILDVKTTTGVFIWKIPEIKRRYKDALDRRTLSLYSPPFHTSPHGYRMCIRAYLNGDGLGKTTHVSVFFVLMRSDHDNLLQWPFRQAVTFQLVNQNDPVKSISETFLPDLKSPSFQQPQSEMNIASGFPRFVSQSVLKDESFIKGNAIYIKCKVDLNGLTFGPT